jgi:hypothetical protein
MSSARGPRVDFKSLSGIGRDSMKPKYSLELSYMAVFLSREDWIQGPEGLTDVQGLVWFTDFSGTVGFWCCNLWA